MTELINYQDIIRSLLLELKDGVVIFIPMLAMVYLFGRALGILNKDWQRNLLALLIDIPVTIYYVYLLYGNRTAGMCIWLIIFKSSLAYVVYVLIGFKLFDRVDNLLDRKVAPDTKTRRRKK